MSQGIASLHKILKDETRLKIITLLNEKGSLGYTELMDATEIGSMGLLNYHLKVLNSLITKNESGQYLLREKGKLASRLLMEFPEADYQSQKRKRQKQFWTVTGIIQVVYLISVLTLYYIRYIDYGKLTIYTLWFTGGIILAYLGYRVQNGSILLIKDNKKRVKLVYTTIGVISGIIIAFFAPIALILIARVFGEPNLAYAQYGGEIWISLFLVLPIVGAIVSYQIGKRKGFTTLHEGHIRLILGVLRPFPTIGCTLPLFLSQETLTGFSQETFTNNLLSVL